VYAALELACAALFWLSVPLLLVYRGRHSDIPWGFVIMSATIFGWILVNASVFFQHAGIDEERLDELACFTTPHDENKSATVVNANGMTETVVENPCGIGEWAPKNYKPWAGLLYGPLYLLCCALPYWLIVLRRVSPTPRRQMAMLAVALLVIEWSSIFGECTAVFGERTFPGPYDQLCNNVDQYIWPPATIVAAFLVSWVVTTQVLRRLGRKA
jgi:hypothetical protein